MNSIVKAYDAENLMGSFCTAPLRAYNSWFQKNIQSSNGLCEHTIWKVCYAVSAVFAYLILGGLAGVGIAINLCLIPPENGYSLWAKMNGTPGGTDEFCKQLRNELLLACRLRAEGSVSSSSSSSTTRCYTYNMNGTLSFDILNIDENEPVIHENAHLLRIVDGEEAIRTQQVENTSNLRLQRMKLHIDYIENEVKMLSQKYGWHPENHSVRTVNNRVIVVIPLPDHVPIPQR